jgi:hypothetical protein
MMLRTPVCLYPIIVSHLSFNFLCLLLLYSIYLNAANFSTIFATVLGSFPTQPRCLLATAVTVEKVTMAVSPLSWQPFGGAVGHGCAHGGSFPFLMYADCRWPLLGTFLMLPDGRILGRWTQGNQRPRKWPYSNFPNCGLILTILGKNLPNNLHT